MVDKKTKCSIRIEIVHDSRIINFINTMVSYKYLFLPLAFTTYKIIKYECPLTNSCNKLFLNDIVNNLKHYQKVITEILHTLQHPHSIDLLDLVHDPLEYKWNKKWKYNSNVSKRTARIIWIWVR